MPFVLCLLLSLGTVATARADLFHFVAADGTPYYSDQASDPRYRLLRSDGAAAMTTAERAAPARLYTPRSVYDAEIQAAARARGIDPALLHALIRVESAYNARAVSPKGARGLMQLMPATARRYGVEDVFDVRQNLRAGAQHLGELLAQFAGNTELALAAYNAGAGAVLAHGRRIPPFAETTRYVPAVLQHYALLRGTPAATPQVSSTRVEKQ